jgi:hypothetical protein
MATIEMQPKMRPSSHKLEGVVATDSAVTVSWSVTNSGNAAAGVVMFVSPQPDLPAGKPSNGGRTVKVDPGATVTLEASYRLTRAESVYLYVVIWDHKKEEVARHQFTTTTTLPSADLELIGEVEIGIE